ncbi:MAG: ABC transporter ATP-binding protein [Acidimicrobiales bacterium]
MISTLQKLLRLVSPKLRVGIIIGILHSVVSALIDASAFIMLYPLLITLTAHKGSQGTTFSRAIISLFGHQTRLQLEIRLGAITIFLFVLSSVVGTLLVRRQSRLASAVEADVATHLFSSYMKTPYLEHVTTNSASMVRNTQIGASDLAINVMLSYLVLFQNMFIVAFLVLLIGIVNPVVVGVSIVYFGFAVFFYAKFITPRARTAGSEGLWVYRNILLTAQEGFSGVKSLLAGNATQKVQREYYRKRYEYAGLRYKLTLYALMPQYYLQSVMIGGVILLIGVIALLHTGNVTALIGLIVAASLRLMPCLYQTLNSVGKIRGGQANVETIYNEMRRLKATRLASSESSEARRRSTMLEVRTNDDTLDAEEIDPAPVAWNRSMRFEHVDFAYPNSNQHALSDVSFEITKGAFIGIVGPSGAGKTTIVDLMLGLIEPTSGAVKIDDARLVGPALVKAWRNSVGYVPQDVFLLDGSVKDNIALGMEVGALDEPAIWRALEGAQIAEFVKQLPDRLETTLGERGVRLSGGQRQRLGIARALFRQPQVLILDEATSSLDTTTEAALALTVRDLDAGNLTRIAIAHRLSTVRDCDALFLFEGGRLVGEGDFISLRRDNEMFNELARLARID